MVEPSWTSVDVGPQVKLQAQSNCFPLLNALIFSNGAHRLLCQSSLGEAFSTSVQQALRRGFAAYTVKKTERLQRSQKTMFFPTAKSNRHICKMDIRHRGFLTVSFPCLTLLQQAFNNISISIPNTNSQYSLNQERAKTLLLMSSVDQIG